jgi:tetratricopeptide (TPR) repeat protein
LTLRRYRLFISLILIATIAIAYPACKSKKKNTFIKRAYHNLTARDNGYFNAKQRIIAAKKQIEKSYVDSYDKLLPVFRFPTEQQSKAVSPQMDEAIKKASLVIQRHEISKWVDDCYLVIGQAYFYKRDYPTANESFQYVAGKYKSKEIANDAYIWLINSYLQLGQIPKAESVINVALGSENFPSRLRSDLYASIASFHIQQKNYVKAIEFLKKAIEESPKKTERVRYHFIIAQLSQTIGEESQAIVYYQRVIKMNPPYEMAFNAKINSAKLSPTSMVSSKRDLEKQLIKLLKDDKNKDYKDQIYYALGNLYERQGNEDKALENYKLSAQATTKNNNQKGLSYLKIATIYFEQPDYEKAQAYYDSTSTFLAKENEGYEEALKRKNSLAILVKNLQVIRVEDSLLTLGKLSEKERIAAVDKRIRQDEEEKIRKEEEEQRIKNNLATNPLTPTSPTTNPGGSTWYFYNTSAVSTGFSDFLKRFGRRPLEDNWRRSSKETILSLNNEQQVEEEDTAGMGNAKTEKEKKRIKYLKNIPVNEKQIAAANDRIVEAYYNIGVFYRDEMVDYQESIKSFEKLLKRFPDNKFKVETYYNLYRLHLNLKNFPKADEYKNIILNDYPNSQYAKVILDPNYTTEARELDKKAQALYEEAYNQYLAGNYTVVFASKSESDKAYASTKVAPKFAYLNALSIAKINGIDSFEVALKDLIKKYPNDEVSVIAKETLKKIQEQKNPSLKKEDNSSVKEDDQYSAEKGTMYFIVAVNIKSNTNETRNEISRFNQLNFSLEKLTLTTQLLDERQNLIIIKEFKDPAVAINYQNSLNAKSVEIIKIPKSDYVTFLISDQNFIKLLKRKDINQYLQFYQKTLFEDE